MSGGSLVGNAADRQQVRTAARKTKEWRAQEVLDLRAVLASVSGRRVLWRWIERLRPLDRLWEPNALLQYKTGMHDVGVMLINEIREADPQAWIRMQQEALAVEPVEKPETAKDDAPEERDDD